MKDFDLQLAVNKSNSTDIINKISQRKPKMTPPFNFEKRISVDLSNVNSLIRLLDSEKEISPSADLLPTLPDKETLDRGITYLRRVHFFCYYCGEEFEDEDELVGKCGIVHLRGRKIENSSSNSTTNLTVQTTFENDNRIRSRINKPNNPDVYTGKQLIQQSKKEFFQKQIVKIEENKYRCSLCSKLFRGPAYVEKHLNLKHISEIEKIEVEALEEQFFLNYLNDPKKLSATFTQPFPHLNPNISQLPQPQLTPPPQSQPLPQLLPHRPLTYRRGGLTPTPSLPQPPHSWVESETSIPISRNFYPPYPTFIPPPPHPNLNLLHPNMSPNINSNIPPNFNPNINSNIPPNFTPNINPNFNPNYSPNFNLNNVTLNINNPSLTYRGRKPKPEQHYSYSPSFVSASVVDPSILPPLAPPTQQLDPRSLREYQDLDAPSEGPIEIDYRMALRK